MPCTRKIFVNYVPIFFLFLDLLLLISSTSLLLHLNGYPQTSGGWLSVVRYDAMHCLRRLSLLCYLGNGSGNKASAQSGVEYITHHRFLCVDGFRDYHCNFCVGRPLNFNLCLTRHISDNDVQVSRFLQECKVVCDLFSALLANASKSNPVITTSLYTTHHTQRLSFCGTS
jgi:hypothetical protein